MRHVLFQACFTQAEREEAWDPDTTRALCLLSHCPTAWGLSKTFASALKPAWCVGHLPYFKNILILKIHVLGDSLGGTAV